MARAPAKGEFTPTNPSKYTGKNKKIIYRSSWELVVMRFFDVHPSVIAWNSEGISIPYQNPLTGKWTFYIPDFLVVYVDKKGKKHAELLEVKPLKERPDYTPKKNERISARTKAAQIVNMAKWTAAVQFCAKNGLYFRVASEDELFAWQKPKGKK